MNGVAVCKAIYHAEWVEAIVLLQAIWKTSVIWVGETSDEALVLEKNFGVVVNALVF